MKKHILLLLLALVMTSGGCGASQMPEMEPEPEISALAVTLPETGPAPVPESTAGTEAPAQPEALELCDGSILPDPAVLQQSGPWTLGDNRIWFGAFEGNPIICRVLPPAQTQTVDEPCLLLDCETILKLKAFDNNFKRNETQLKLPTEWRGSDIETWLNGNEFYGDPGIFTEAERAAIASTVLADVPEPYTGGSWVKRFTDYGSTDSLFLLSAAEAETVYADDASRVKVGAGPNWWLRSAFEFTGNGVGSIHIDGHVCNNSVSNFGVGVSPAMNVKLSAILFVTPLEGEKEWKLTLRDPNLGLSCSKWSREGDLVTVSCALEGKKADQISVLITDKPWQADARVIYTGAAGKFPVAKESTGAFLLPEELADRTWGSDYHVYLLAQTLRNEHQSDSASELVELTM